MEGGVKELSLNNSASLSSVVIAQNLIEWQAFIEGYFAKEWK